MKKLLSLLIIASFLFSFAACISGTDEQSEFTPATAQEELDVDTVVQAVNSKNIELCETVENSEQKQDCKIKVEDQILLDEAVNNSNLDDCDKITQTNTKEKCEILVQEELDKINKMEEIEDEQQLSAEIVESGDIDQCDSLTNEGIAEQCKINIYLKKAQEENDPSYCDNLEEQALVSMCKEQIE
jgi:hypothetical protein